MTKCCTFKKTKPGEPIPVTARQLESFMLEHKGKFNSRERVHKLSLWAELEDINHYGDDSNKIFYHLANR